VTQRFDAAPSLVFDAWTKPELFKLWWVPKSRGIPMLSCDMDVRAGGSYRIMFGHDAANSMAFFGKYLEVSVPSRLVWTNDESDDAAVTTVTFEEKDGGTLLVLRELYPSKEALDESFIGMEDTMPEQFEQLDELLITLGASA
jgi:uncharacterized protein YndB with AHSA1/START domain